MWEEEPMPAAESESAWSAGAEGWGMPGAASEGGEAATASGFAGEAGGPGQEPPSLWRGLLDTLFGGEDLLTAHRAPMVDGVPVEQRTTVGPDGTRTTDHADGRQVIQRPDGSSTERIPRQPQSLWGRLYDTFFGEREGNLSGGSAPR